MKVPLRNLADLITGIYAKPDILADTFYLQVKHFSDSGDFDSTIKPQLQFSDKYKKHLLQNEDILFAAKGFNNFATIYYQSIGRAVAASSFIIIRIITRYKRQILPEFLTWYINNSSQIEIFHKTKATTTVPSISIAQLSTLEVNVPDLHMQKHILNIQRLRDKEKKTTRKLELLKDQLVLQKLINASKR